MFDITSSKLLILGIVALLVIGPKDLPALLRTIGKYLGIIKRQAAEFRAQFDEAMRESEVAQLKKEMETIAQDTEATMRAAEASVETEVAKARQSVDKALEGEAQLQALPGELMAQNADGLPAPGAGAASDAAGTLNGATHHADAVLAADAAEPPITATAEASPEPGRAPEKSGA